MDLQDSQITTLSVPFAPFEDLRSTVPMGQARIDLAERRARFVRGMETGMTSASHLKDKFKGQKLIICGGGPSIEKTLPDIRMKTRLSKRTKILALNKTHDWLLKKGVTPHFGCMADPAQHVSTYQTPQKNTIYLLGSSLHKDTLHRFRNHKSCYMWHPVVSDPIPGDITDIEWFNQNYPNASRTLVSGKSTVGLLSLTLMTVCLGFTELELHGFDSCDAPRPNGADRKLYPYDKPNMETSLKDVTMKALNGDEFHYEANEHMARQSYEFFDALTYIADAQISGRMPYFDIKVAGDGAIPWQSWKINDHGGIHVTPDRMKAKYGNAKYWDYAQDKAVETSFRAAA